MLLNTRINIIIYLYYARLIMVVLSHLAMSKVTSLLCL